MWRIRPGSSCPDGRNTGRRTGADFMGEMMDYVWMGLGAAAVLLLALMVALQLSQRRADRESQQRQRQLTDAVFTVRKDNEQTVSNVLNGMRTLGEMLNNAQAQASGIQDKRLLELSQSLIASQQTLQKNLGDNLRSVDGRMAELLRHTEQRLDLIRNTMAERIANMQADNQKQLEQMRLTVDEKLQKTLEERISQSFRQVSERLEQVYKGLGEMQTLAIGVGDLKKVLSGVKTRGILGEIQLGAILEQILSQEQYETNVVTKPSSNFPVEYAVKLPGDDDGAVYLPIDAKFPMDTYSALLDAYDTADASNVQAATRTLERTIKAFAKSMRDKYISAPHTTDFAIMFLPFEGLYAEVVRIGLVETLQRDYHVNIAGPTTMAAILNSLQMGFRTLSIQKHSSEVWKILGEVRTEFDNFAQVLDSTRNRLTLAQNDLEKLVGVRTRQIQRKLRAMDRLPQAESQELLELTDWEDPAEEENQ